METLIQVDYSESYKKSSRMRYRAHILANHHLAFFAAAVYHLDSDRNLVERSVAVISESSNHSQIAALTCIDFVIKEVERRTNSSKIIMWSNGCAAQFRLRIVFKLLANHCRDLQLEWNCN